MASVSSIAKAKAVGLGLQKLTGVEPQYEYQNTLTRVYYRPADIPTVRRKIAEMGKGSGGDVVVDWLPIVTPELIKAALPYAAVILAAGFLIGRIR